MQYQNDGHNCGIYAIAFAVDILDGLSPMESYFDVTQMRSHLINCLENEKLTSFPNVQNHACVVLSDAINVFNILGRRGAVVKLVEDNSTIVLVNI